MFSRMAKKVNDVVSTVVADTFMGGSKYKRQARNANAKADILRADRSNGPVGNMPYPADESNPNFRTRVMANNIRYQYKRDGSKTWGKSLTSP